MDKKHEMKLMSEREMLETFGIRPAMLGSTVKPAVEQLAGYACRLRESVDALIKERSELAEALEDAMLVRSMGGQS